MTKSSYKEAFRKHKLREFVMNVTQPYRPKSKIVGLAGPDINEYIKWCNSYGYTNIEVYEMNRQVMLHQLNTLGGILPINLVNADILKAPYEPNTFYDLDFCGSVRHLQDHISKFDSHFMMTFSTRIGVSETIATFMNARDEDMYCYETKRTENYTWRLIYGRRSYLMLQYFDTSAMCTFCDIPSHTALNISENLRNR